MKIQTGGFWYLASPYSGTPEEMDERADAVCWYMGVILKDHGIVTYCPIWSCHHIALEHKLPRDHEYWEAFNKIWIDRALGTMVAMIPGWRQSKGVKQEIEYTLSIDKPILYVKRLIRFDKADTVELFSSRGR